MSRASGPIDLKGRPPPTIPTSLVDGERSAYAEEWRAAREDEDKSMEEREVFHYVPRPKGVRVIGSRYHHQIKTNKEGQPTRFNMRLIAQGFGQRPGIDYEEEYTPVASMSTIKTGLAWIARERLEAFTIDVKTAYLHAPLDKSKGVRYMEQPPGPKVLDENGEIAVCELDMAIYGLPEAAAAWYNRLKDYLSEIDLHSVEEDTCVFVGSLEGERIVIIIYVDDGIIGASEAGKQKFMAKFGKEFEVEEKGPLDGQTFVGLEIKYNREAGIMEVRQEGHTMKIDLGVRGPSSFETFRYASEGWRATPCAGKGRAGSSTTRLSSPSRHVAMAHPHSSGRGIRRELSGAMVTQPGREAMGIPSSTHSLHWRDSRRRYQVGRSQ